MTNRSVKVELLADVRGFSAGMAQARTAAKQLGTEFKQQSQEVGGGLTAIGVAAGVGVGLAVKKFAEFDQAMSFVQAATHESAASMKLLREAALEAGASTVFSAQESANAIEELSKAGVSTAAILSGGLSGALDLAAAGGLGVADAAGIAATALTQFKLEGSDVPHVADLLAAGAGKAMGSVQDLSAALNQGGLVANQTGLTIEETTGTLSAFAAAGLLGSDAGTSMKTMLQRLTPQSAEAKAKMDELGISAYNAQGQFIGMEKFAGVLQSGLKDLTPEARNSALAVMFGSDAVRAASVVYDQGAEGIKDWIGKVNDSGYAAETARIRLDNLSGDVEQLGGAFDTAFIKGGTASDEALRFLTQTLTEMVTAFGDAPAFVQQTAFALGAVVTVVGLAGGAMLLAVPKVVEFGAALTALSTSKIPGVAAAATSMIGATAGATKALGATASFLSGPWGIALMAAAVGVAVLTKHLDSLKASSAEIQNSLAMATSAAQIFATIGEGREWTAWQDVKAQLSDLPSVLQAAAEQSGNLFARLDSTNFGAFNALKDLGMELGQLASTDLPGAQKSFRMLTAETDGSAQSQWRLLNTMPGYMDALKALAKEQGVNVTSADEAANKTNLLKLAFGNAAPTALEAADAYLAAAEESAGLAGELESLIGLINEANGVGQDAVSSNATWQASLAGITSDIEAQKKAYEEANGSLDGFTFSLDESTASGSANAAMLSGVAADAQAAAQAQYELDQKTMSAKDATDKYVGTLATSRQSLVDQAIANGANAEEVQKLADKVFGLPDLKATQLLVEKAAATAAIDQFVRDLNNIPGQRDVVINQVVRTTGASQGVVGAAYNATGGAISGPGTGTSDSILSWLSNGEHVLTADDVSRMGGQSAVYRFRERLGSGLPAFAQGGMVGQTQDELSKAEKALGPLNARLKDAEHMKTASDNWVAAANAGLKHQLPDARASLEKWKKEASAAEGALKVGQQRVRDLRGTLLTLQRAGADYASGTARGSNQGTFSAVDQLRSMSRSDTYSAGNQRAMSQAATTAERSLVSLEKRSKSAATAVEKASDKLDLMKDRAGNLASASAQMAAGIASSLRGAVRPEDAFKAGFTVAGTSKEVWKRKGNLTWAETQTTAEKTVGASVSATGVAAFYKGQAGKVSAFAAQLKKLAAKGVNGALLEEIAAMGVDQGGQMATALLSASASQISSINSSYKAIGGSASAAGQTVADANFKKQIEAAEKQIRLAESQLKSAEKNAAAVQVQIKAQTDRIVNIIKSTLGLAAGHATGGTVTGIGSATSDSNLRWLSAGEEITPAGPAAKHRSLLRMIAADRLGAGIPTYVQSAAGRGSAAAMQDAPPVLVQVEFKDAALRQMVQVEVKQQDDRSRVMLEVM